MTNNATSALKERQQNPWSSRRGDVRHNRYTTWAILAISLLLTILASYLTNRHVAKRNQDHFAFLSRKVKESIEERLLGYEQVLRGGVALYNSNPDLTREEWHRYVTDCEIQRHFPGIQAMAVAVPVSPQEKQTHEALIRSESFQDCMITPTDARDAYSEIVFIEPFDWCNRRTFGYDMHAETHRRDAMNRAIQTGLPTFSNKITLVQESDEDQQAGVLCYLPIYQSDMPCDTAEERKLALKAWGYAALRCDDLMQGIVGSHDGDVEFRVFDSSTTDPETILFSSNICEDTVERDLYAARIPLEVPGQEWTLQCSATSAFRDANGSSLSVFVALVNTLLLAVVCYVTRQRLVATGIAERMAEKLWKSERQTRTILENATEAIVSISNDGVVLAANKASFATFKNERLIGTKLDDLLTDITSDQLLELARNEVSAAELTLQCRKNDGTQFPCRLSVGRVDTSVEQTYIMIARDESRRIESERELAEANRQLEAVSRRASIAEVTTGTLHNVGNAINSVSTSSGAIDQHLSAAAIDQLEQAVDLISNHDEDLADFIRNDERGQHFLRFLQQVTITIRDNRQTIREENQRLKKHITHIREVIRAQQGKACRTAVTIEKPSSLMDQAVQLSNRHGYQFQFHRDYDETPTLSTDRHKVLQILVNLIGNAQDAVRDHKNRPMKIVVRTRRIDNDTIAFAVEDNGVGIPAESLESVLDFGFTTKPDGHGFGLHSCVVAAKALGGELRVESDGLDCGAKFTLLLPIENSSSEASPRNETQEPPLAQLA